MRQTKKSKINLMSGVAAKALAIMSLALIMLVAVPAVVYADNTVWQSQNFSNPNWQNMHHTNNWNWQHNWAYQAPEYRFETTFPFDQWGRPTTSNVAPQHTQNIRRDRHAAYLPPSHGTNTGFFSGEFPTNQANPFAPRYNNNPAAGHAVAIEESPFAVRSGEPGLNVRADGSHAGGFMASTGVAHGGGSSGSSNAPHGGPVYNTNPPWTSPGNQSNIPGQSSVGDQGGFTVTHRPLEPSQPPQTGGQQNRVTTVTPFDDGTIGRIMIPALNNRVASVRPGVALSTLDNYVGHFSYTSQWDGNIALASHNRGQGSFFAGIWTLRGGDRIIYETTMGVRVFEVISIDQISERDLTNLNHSHENTLTLITCVYGRPELRWSLRAREVV